MDMSIYIRPITFSWCSEWLPRYRSCFPRMKAALDKFGPVAAAKEVGDWQREVDIWLSMLEPRKRTDIIDLLRAEEEMLWETINPGHSPKPAVGSWEWSEFRDRHHTALVLALACQRCGFDRASATVDYYRALEAYAEQQNWLP